MEAYCVKCKVKREIQNPKPDFNINANALTRGVCGVCGTRIIRMGKTPEHEGITPPEKISHRKGKLVIVESPAKAKTVGRFLGSGYTVKASVGHVRDLLRSTLSVDVENNFQPKYRVPNEKKGVIKEIKTLAKGAEEIYLATDPDREGEAIAWHLIEAASIEEKLTKRVVFHEITKSAVAEAFSHPRKVDMHLVDAQQGRRVLDRLVGYNLSPLLWEKVRNRLSAGRVQSVALRLVVERENEIDEFTPKEYWTIDAELKPLSSEKTYLVRLVRVDGKEIELSNEIETKTVLEDLEKASFSVLKISRRERKRKPAAPFITSTMQQEASRRLGFTAKRTMAVAQQLYEGLDIGEEGGNTGLITYMRTDSTHVAELAQKEAHDFIVDSYGESYAPLTPPVYTTKVAGAQEAHEAVRPTSVLRLPKAIKPLVSKEQYQLYELIWQRFVSSQMQSAVYDTLTVEIQAPTPSHQYLLRVSGSTVKFPGFLIVYEESRDERQINEEENENARIPENLSEGDEQQLVHLAPEQHFTQPPPRYSEATLVRALEENGIGRPSTYAPIMSTIQQRGYVSRENKQLIPTETGMLVNTLLVDHFPEIVDTQFTATMETLLDQVAAGDRQWQNVISEFYMTFEPQVKLAQANMPVVKTELEKIGRECPKCGHDLVIRYGRYGKFISCSSFPECRFTEPWLEKIGVKCPDCHDGDVVQRKSKKGRVFYGCNNYPNCQFVSWKRPIPATCKNCGGQLVIANKREAKCMICEETILLEQLGDINVETA